jgi:hypothetical protein
MPAMIRLYFYGPSTILRQARCEASMFQAAENSQTRSLGVQRRGFWVRCFLCGLTVVLLSAGLRDCAEDGESGASAYGSVIQQISLINATGQFSQIMNPSRRGGDSNRICQMLSSMCRTEKELSAT